MLLARSTTGFYGSNRVALIDDFMLFNQPNTRQFYASGALAVQFDPLDIAAKNGASDKTVAVEVANRTIWVFGEKTTEVWYNTGASDFAFARYPGTFIEYGCKSPASIAAADTSYVRQMSALMISTPALTDELRTYPRLDDAIGYTQADGPFLRAHVPFCRQDMVLRPVDEAVARMAVDG